MAQPAGDTILVTGASGFVGSAVVRAAQAAGYLVRALVRPTSVRSNLDGLNEIELAEGDLRDAAAMLRAARGVRYVFHVAADYRLWVPDPRPLYAANVDGTRNVMRAALDAGVERVIYTSSVATLKVAPNTDAATEADALAEADAIGVYKRSKVAAERLVEQMVANEGLQAVIVNPSTPIGARDIRPTPTGRIIVQAASGAMPAYVDTGLNLVGVEDVARGHLLALARGRVGERYILGGDNLALETLLREIADLVGRRPPLFEVPRWPLYPLAMFAESLARVTGKEPFVTRDGLKMSRNRMFFSSEKAQRELGYVARDHRIALGEAIDWFGKSGYLH
jgi:dihydroflavonol-4-reductase